jgi:hypothetical protein
VRTRGFRNGRLMLRWCSWHCCGARGTVAVNGGTEKPRHVAKKASTPTTKMSSSAPAPAPAPAPAMLVGARVITGPPSIQAVTHAVVLNDNNQLASCSYWSHSSPESAFCPFPSHSMRSATVVTKGTGAYRTFVSFSSETWRPETRATLSDQKKGGGSAELDVLDLVGAPFVESAFVGSESNGQGCVRRHTALENVDQTATNVSSGGDDDGDGGGGDGKEKMEARPERSLASSPERPLSSSPERPLSSSPERPLSSSPERPLSSSSRRAEEDERQDPRVASSNPQRRPSIPEHADVAKDSESKRRSVDLGTQQPTKLKSLHTLIRETSPFDSRDNSLVRTDSKSLNPQDEIAQPLPIHQTYAPREIIASQHRLPACMSQLSQASQLVPNPNGQGLYSRRNSASVLGNIQGGGGSGCTSARLPRNSTHETASHSGMSPSNSGSNTPPSFLRHDPGPMPRSPAIMALATARVPSPLRLAGSDTGCVRCDTGCVRCDTGRVRCDTGHVRCNTECVRCESNRPPPLTHVARPRIITDIYASRSTGQQTSSPPVLTRSSWIVVSSDDDSDELDDDWG